MSEERFIVHVDMDAFFASIEQRDNPALRDKAVVVGANPKRGRGRGVVSTCSYEARRFGIHSAMPISLAYQKCPHAIYLPVDMDKYSAVSQKIYRIFYDFTPDIEPISIDEAFLDITHSYSIYGAPYQTCVAIKSRIKEETGLTASLGLAPIKMAAKIASDLQKPDGLVVVSQKELLGFLHPLAVDKIWGLGKKGVEALNGMGIKTIGELAGADIRTLISAFGKNGILFWQLANGIDERQVQTDGEAKSVSNELTFDKDTLDKAKIESSLAYLCEKVSGRLRQDSLKGKTITLKIRLEGFHTYTRSATVSKPTNFEEVIWKQIKQLYDNFENKDKKVRLVGVKVSGLSATGREESLFVDNEDEKKEQVHRALDKIKEKFGDAAIFRATRITKD
ncbi:MAG: DNA polymerase IV [Deltaproteobacteria bacterium]